MKDQLANLTRQAQIDDDPWVHNRLKLEKERLGMSSRSEAIVLENAVISKKLIGAKVYRKDYKENPKSELIWPATIIAIESGPQHNLLVYVEGQHGRVTALKIHNIVIVKDE